jgi:RHS repeat-associated protein
MRVSATMTPAGDPAVTEGYVWNGDNLLMDAANAYIYTTGTAPAEQVDLATGAVTYLVTDYLGSVRGTVNAAGALTGTTSYDAWGNPETPGGLTATSPFGYGGGYTDPTGLIYLINRYYDPVTGQFTSVDPDVADTLQPYAYAAGNPVSATDPNGLSAAPPPGGGGNGYPPGTTRYVWYVWKDHWGHLIPLRQGNNKYGWAHAERHYVTPQIIGETITHANRRVHYRHGGATNWNYAIWVRDEPLYEYENIDIRKKIVVGTWLGSDWADGLPPGVLTGYCVGSNICPSWVWKNTWEFVKGAVYSGSGP